MGVRLNQSPSTIYYELSRCQPYQAELAQTDAEYKRSRCGRKTKLSDELKQKILNHLRLSWSPGMIAHEFKLATKSIYNWLNQGRIGFSLIVSIIGYVITYLGYGMILFRKDGKGLHDLLSGTEVMEVKNVIN